jgi:hypothetical protein
MRTRGRTDGRTDGQSCATGEDVSAIAIIRARLLEMSHSQLSLATDNRDRCCAVFTGLYKQIMGFYITVSTLVKLYVRNFDLSS